MNLIKIPLICNGTCMSFSGNNDAISTPLDGNSLASQLPTRLSQLENDVPYVTDTSGGFAYSNLRGRPTSVSEFANDAGYLSDMGTLRFDASNISTGVLRSDQIPWPSGSILHVEASNVYGDLSNAYLDVSHLIGSIPASQVTGTLTNASIDFGKISNPPSTSDIVVSTQNINFLNTNQVPYYSSNYLIDEYQESFKCWGNTINRTITNTVYEYRLTLGVPEMAHNYTNYTGVKILENVGVEADKLVGKIAAAALPSFLTPIISYDVTSDVPAPAQGPSRTLRNTIAANGWQTYEMTDEFRKLYNPSFPTDDAIVADLNTQIASAAGYDNKDYQPITDLTDVQSLTVHSTVRKSVLTSNMRFSLAGFKNFQADAIVSSNISVKGDVNVTGNLSATSIVCGGVTLGGSSGSSSSSSGGDTAMGVLGMIFGAFGAVAGGVGYFGSKAAGAVGPPGANGLPGVMGPPGPAGPALPQLTLREMIDAAEGYFNDKVNLLINNYAGGPDNAENVLKYILRCLSPEDRANVPAGGLYGDRDAVALWLKNRRIAGLMGDIVERAVQAAGLQLVQNPLDIPPVPVDGAAIADVVDVAARGIAYILPNMD